MIDQRDQVSVMFNWISLTKKIPKSNKAVLKVPIYPYFFPQLIWSAKKKKAGVLLSEM